MVRKKNILKDALRQIRFSKKRFNFLILIVGLLTSIYVSLNLVSPSLIKSANAFYNKNNAMDVTLSSPTGFIKDDYNLIKQIPNSKGIMMVKTLNTKITANDMDFHVKAISISRNRNKKDDDYINRLTLVSGKYPLTINEGLVEESFLNDNNLKLGDLITLKPENKNDLKAKKIKIVGTVKSVSYSSSNSNFSSSWKKESDYFIYLEERNFNTEYYNEIYLTLKNEKLDTHSKKYKTLIDEYKNEVKVKLTPIVNERYKRRKTLYQNNVTLLEEKLNGYYNLDLPEKSLNESIKQTSNDLENEKAKLSDLKSSEIIITERTKTPSFYKIEFAGNKIKKLAFLSPLVLLPILCLIYLNFMEKITQEEKKQISVKKAIGFSTSETSSKYILYVFLSSILGSVIGTLVFSKLILGIISLCFTLYFDVPFLCLKIKLWYIIPTILLTVIVSIIVCITYLFSYNKKEKNIPSNKRIIPLFKKLSLSSKMAFRSAFKSKARLILQTILIAFITGLLLSSFGIKDSVNTSIKKQYKNIFNFDLLVFTNETSQKELSNIQKDVQLNKNVKNTLKINQSNVKIDGMDEMVYIIIPEDKKKLESFISLKSKNSKKNLNMKDDGIIISEGLAKKLNKKKNGSLKIMLNNGLAKKIKITDIVSCYTDNYVYMTSNLYKNISNSNIEFNTLLINLKDKKKDKITALELSEINKVKSVMVKSEIRKDKQNKLSIVNSYSNALVMITFILTFIILYMISRFNRIEKANEAEIMKSLGLYDKEISSYVYKENLIITAIGTLIGIIIGNLITYYFIKNMGILTFAFGFKISIISYLIILLLIFISQLIITIFIHFNLINQEMLD